MQFDFNDYVLVQAPYGLNSRSEINLEYVPIITAPMDTVVNEFNAEKFRGVGITVCLPRNVKVSPNETDFISLGLNEFRVLLDGENNLNGKKICIDVANGNMVVLHEMIKECKIKYPNSIIMSGNVASETAYHALSAAGCDYIRVGVGSGSGCLTSVHTGVGQGLATLIQRCVKLRLERNLKSKIVADGGFKNYRDIILALAMGADYIMLGGILNKCLESCAPKKTSIETHIYDWVMSDLPLEYLGHPYTTNYKQISFDDYIIFLQKYQEKFPNEKVNFNFSDIIKEKEFFVDFRGMSTKAVQKDWGRQKLTSSEGIQKQNKVEYTLIGWMENFCDYLKSAMSYSGTITLEEFKTMAEYETISVNVYQRFNK